MGPLSIIPRGFSWRCLLLAFVLVLHHFGTPNTISFSASAASVSGDSGGISSDGTILWPQLQTGEGEGGEEKQKGELLEGEKREGEDEEGQGGVLLVGDEKGEGGVGGQGRAEEDEGEDDADEDIGVMGDRSAQIIRQQDAEEGERWAAEETAWSPLTDENGNTDRSDTLCKKPSPPENGYLRGDDYDDGGVVRIFCEVGYTLQGPSKITCVPVPHIGVPGVWLPQDEYRCLPSEPSIIEIHTLDRRGGNSAGPAYTVVDVNGHDTDKQPASKEDIRCPKPSVPLHGRLEGTDYSLYATVRITCEESYHLIGPDHITCLPVPDPFHHVGIWEPQQMPTCHTSPPVTPPWILFDDVPNKDTQPHLHLQTAHRQTDTLPDTRHAEGLPSLCSQPKVVGPCRASIPSFYYDSFKKECLPFNYGGCRGNDNNFETFADCQKACH